MLVSLKWQTMWLESQHCSKNITNMQLSSQLTQKVLEDLKTSCCSPNKTVQLEALKCWGIWINNQSPDGWKVNTICFTAVRPLISKKLQPLFKDVDVCKMKLSLMWALLTKVQNIMHLEGPQYILEVFLQSCLTWLFSINEDGCENEISTLIFQLLLGMFKTNETISGCDKKLFPPLSTDILLSNKVFHHFADKFLNIFIQWRKVRDKSVILKLWKHFLEHCELSCEHIPIPVWHKIFKLAGQICSEKNESVKERLSFLHSCATTLKLALSSSKFIDFGNLLTTPCEALFKKLVELCTVECNDRCDLEMFIHAKEICQVLSDRIVGVGGFDLCISVVDVLEEFSLKSLFWGVWCGLVHCYKVHLLNKDKNHFTKVQMTFYRKLRGVAVNLELDRNNLHQDCIAEVEKHIEVLNISCFCSFSSKVKVEECSRETGTLEVMDTETLPLDPPSLSLSPSGQILPVPVCGEFFKVSVYNRSKLPTKTFSVSFGLIKNILDNIGINSALPLFNGLFNFRFITLQTVPHKSLIPLSRTTPLLSLKTVEKAAKSAIVPRIKAKNLQPVCSPAKKTPPVEKDPDEDVISTPRTRSRKRAEEEEKKKKEMETRGRKKRKSFELIVQEIVRKNKERKTEKNIKDRRSPDALKATKKKKKIDKVGKNKNKSKPVEVSERKLRNSKKEEPTFQKKKEKKLPKTDGKLENYFKIITKRSGNVVKKEEKLKKAKKVKTSESCCNSDKESEKKGETAWRQTSLKTMMNEKSKPEKVKPTLRTRNNKAAEVTEEKPKTKKDNRKVTDSPLAKLSPFKEVLHDHEYAKIEPNELQSFEKVLLAKKEKADEEKPIKKYKNSKKNDVQKIETQEAKIEEEKIDSTPQVKEIIDLDSTQTATVEKTNQEEQKMEVTPEKVEESSGEKETPLVSPTLDLQPSNNDTVVQVEFKEITTTPTKKAKKRVKIPEGVKPNKKLKLDEEEKLPLEITEKENLEEKQTDVNAPKKEKLSGSVKNDESPKAINGMISSRALRMIALLPESTKSSQIQWDSPSRVELFKSKKAPNVDLNSRASKMLALLTENIVEVVEANESKIRDVNSNKPSVTTPNIKTPISSLKSPNSIKKRRSIRFDDARNETVLYETNTPPSQIHEEKEKCRRIKPEHLIQNIP